ncbi:MAG: helix-turn-helix transcriptional regulator [Bacteroides sp.]|jgi:predicted XRE-type DNA-binding protein|uniref:XRE family transcriptional regulator n=1 Tax=Bacteroides sp. TaxID=29523 RepID=UPI0025C3D703|nr:XRE family transcriptional regulator [Bacteroides sp.]MBS6237453.1 helix-turn-helix transcriptional regulator [Bacteroides sp.]
MANLNIDCITTREQYDEVRSRVDSLIKEATQKGMLEPGADNEYVREISRLAKLSAEYEDNYLNILPLRVKNPLIQTLEDYFYGRSMKRKEAAELLGINESVFSQIMNGKRKISTTLAKKLYSDLHIDANLILQNL